VLTGYRTSSYPYFQNEGVDFSHVSLIVNYGRVLLTVNGDSGAHNGAQKDSQNSPIRSPLNRCGRSHPRMPSAFDHPPRGMVVGWLSSAADGSDACSQMCTPATADSPAQV